MDYAYIITEAPLPILEEVPMPRPHIEVIEPQSAPQRVYSRQLNTRRPLPGPHFAV